MCRIAESNDTIDYYGFDKYFPPEVVLNFRNINSGLYRLKRFWCILNVSFMLIISIHISLVTNEVVYVFIRLFDILVL